MFNPSETELGYIRMVIDIADIVHILTSCISEEGTNLWHYESNELVDTFHHINQTIMIKQTN